jgi:hypothetical protein
MTSFKKKTLNSNIIVWLCAQTVVLHSFPKLVLRYKKKYEEWIDKWVNKWTFYLRSELRGQTFCPRANMFCWWCLQGWGSYYYVRSGGSLFLFCFEVGRSVKIYFLKLCSSLALCSLHLWHQSCPQSNPAMRILLFTYLVFIWWLWCHHSQRIQSSTENWLYNRYPIQQWAS